MEDFFENLEYSSLNIHELWLMRDEKKYRNILNSYKSTIIHIKIRDILKSAKIFLTKVGSILSNNFFVIFEDRIEYEHAACEIFQSIINEIDLNKQIDAFATTSFVDIFSFIKNEIIKSIFKMKTLIFMLQITGESKTFLTYLHFRHIKIIFNSLELDLIEDEYDYNFDCKIFQEEIEKFFNNVKDNFIKHNISTIQTYYEFLTLKSKSIPNCPYAAIAKIILNRCVSVENIACKTIYFDLINSDFHDEKILILINKDEKIAKLLKLFPKSLQVDLNIAAVDDFISEISKLVTHINSKGECFVLENYFSEICEKVLDVFMNTVIFDRFQQNKICSNFAKNLQKPIQYCHSFESNQELIHNIIIYLNKISKNIIEKMESINQKLIQNYITILQTFCPIVTMTKIDNFHSEIIELILNLVNLLNASKNINIVEFLIDLIKNNLNAKMSSLLNQIEWVLIITGILNYLFTLNDTNSLNRIYEQLIEKKRNIKSENAILKELVGCLIEKIKMNYKVVSYIQDCLFDYIICRTIEMKSDHENFYDIIQLFYPLLSFGHLAVMIHKLKPVFNRSLQDDKRNIFDPNRIKFYQQPSSLFLKFYTIISVLLQCKPDARQVLQEEIIELIDILEFEQFYIEKVKDPDDFNNEENSQELTSFTIYYFILVSFTTTIVEDVDYDFEIVSRIIKIWFKLYMKKSNDANVKNNFEKYITSLGSNYPTILNFFSEKLWDFYLIKDQYQFAQNLSTIFNISNLFAKKYDMMFYKKILNRDSLFLASTSTLLIQIAQYYPEFFLIKNDLNELRIITLIRLATSIKDAKFLKNLLNSFQVVIEIIEKSKDKGKINIKKADGYAVYLIQYSNELKNLISFSNDKNDYEEMLQFMACFYCFLANNLRYQKLEKLLKNLKILCKDISNNKNDINVKLEASTAVLEKFNEIITKVEQKLSVNEFSDQSDNEREND